MTTASILEGELHAATDDPARIDADLPAPSVQSHAANLMVLPNRDLGCVWFGGTQEGLSDISVWFSRLPHGTSQWTTPIKLSDDPTRSEQNPILFPAPDGRLWLLHTAQKSGNQDTALVRYRISEDNGLTWRPTSQLFDAQGVFVRQPVVVLDNGDWLLGVFHCRTEPGAKWVGNNDDSAVRISTDQGKSWFEVAVPNSTGCVHMNIVKGARGLLAFFRSRWADNVYISRSADNGRTWSSPTPTTLPNNNSSIQVTRLANGHLAIVYNDISAAEATERRQSLYDEIEDEDSTATETPVAAPSGRTAFWGTPRAPMTVAISADDGETWPWKRNLEVGDGYCMTNNSSDQRNREYSYPSITQSADGTIHIAYTVFRQKIRYVRIREQWVTGQAAKGEGRVKPFVALVTAMHLSPEAQSILTDAGGEIAFMPDPIDEDSLIARFAQGPVHAVVLRGSKPFTARVLGAASHLEVIAKNGAGVDSVDIECATRHGVAVMVAAGANAEAVAEHSIALMLALTRDLFGLDRKVRAAGWEGTGYQGRDFRNSTVGIIGFGSIGRSTAQMAAALGAKVIVMDAFTKSEQFEMVADLDDLLVRADIVSLHCPLTERTRGLIGVRELGTMKKGAILINTARGPLVDEAALIASLRSGHLAGAGLDTFETEPIEAGNPLLQMPNVILTPHVAGVTRNAVLGVSTITATNVVDRINGRPLDRRNLVNPEVLR